MCDRLNAARLLDLAGAFRTFTVSGYAVEGDNPLGEAQTQAALAPFVGKHDGIERLQQAAAALEALLRENGYGFYRVVLPPQDIGGVIRLQMFKFTVGTVEVKGNQFFSNDNILRSMPQVLWSPALAENTRMLVFYDFGEIRRHNDATLPSATVTSFGLGVRWSMGKSLAASLDLGHVLRGRSKLPAGTSRDRAHLNISYQF